MDEQQKYWRVGTKIPINVYDGDRPVCQCQTALDARLIVYAVNELLERRAATHSANDTPDAVNR
ncbi:MAG TPA: hypothetical protein VKR23_16005 [Gaiellaceae bacterium]|nr:hypothetical protein [Gaiellaceae bacterium]